MYFNVVVKNTIMEDINSNELVFTFYNLDKAINFAKNILLNSDYHIEMLQFEEERE